MVQTVCDTVLLVTLIIVGGIVVVTLLTKSFRDKIRILSDFKHNI